MKPVKKVFVYKRKSCVSLYVSCVLSLALNADNCKLYDVVSKRLRGGFSSLRASSLFGGYREKWTHERHARGDAKAGSGERKASRPLAASPLAHAFSCGSLRSPKQESLLAGYGFARHHYNIASSAICSWSLNATK